MKKAIFAITLTLVTLVIAGSAIGCTEKTTTAGTTPTTTATTTKTTTATTTTPTTPLTPSQPMDLTGTWSGTHVQSGPNWATYYDATLNLTQQQGNMVNGTLALHVQRTENSFSSDQNMDFFGQLSGNTLQGPLMGMTYQVSGNSMTGQGRDTSGTGPTAVTWDWSWNLTRVR